MRDIPDISTTLMTALIMSPFLYLFYKWCEKAGKPQSKKSIAREEAINKTADKVVGTPKEAVKFVFGWKYILPVWLIGSILMMNYGEHGGGNPIWFWLGCISLVGGFIAMGWGGSGDIGSHDIDPD